LEIQDSSALDLRIEGKNGDDRCVGRGYPVAGPLPVARDRYYIAKRIVDLILASILILVSIPILLIIAIAIRFDSSGPIIFAQQRLRSRRTKSDGALVWSLETFTLYKFRTMETNADPSFHRNYMAAYLVGDEAGLMMLRPGRQMVWFACIGYRLGVNRRGRSNGRHSTDSFFSEAMKAGVTAIEENIRRVSFLTRYPSEHPMRPRKKAARSLSSSEERRGT
jgi:lipopolysaccharide/colanic/teichoic acid biosynthesis glycosyltransferase